MYIVRSSRIFLGAGSFSSASSNAVNTFESSISRSRFSGWRSFNSFPLAHSSLCRDPLQRSGVTSLYAQHLLSAGNRDQLEFVAGEVLNGLLLESSYCGDRASALSSVQVVAGQGTYARHGARSIQKNRTICDRHFYRHGLFQIQRNSNNGKFRSRRWVLRRKRRF